MATKDTRRPSAAITARTSATPRARRTCRDESGAPPGCDQQRQSEGAIEDVTSAALSAGPPSPTTGRRSAPRRRRPTRARPGPGRGRARAARRSARDANPRTLWRAKSWRRWRRRCATVRHDRGGAGVRLGPEPRDFLPQYRDTPRLRGAGPLGGFLPHCDEPGLQLARDLALPVAFRSHGGEQCLERFDVVLLGGERCLEGRDAPLRGLIEPAPRIRSRSQPGKECVGVPTGRQSSEEGDSVVDFALHGSTGVEGRPEQLHGEFALGAFFIVVIHGRVGP